MSKTLLFAAALIGCSSILAQNPATAVYPGALATDTTLGVLCNSAHTTLAAGIGPTDLSITVVSAASLCSPTYVTIDAKDASVEVLKICSISGNALTVCSGGRGAHTAGVGLAHPVGASLDGFIDANALNQAYAELMAIESELGVNLANVLTAAAGYSPLDLTKLTVLWQGCNDIGSLPYFALTVHGTAAATCIAAPSSDDPAGFTISTGSTSGSNATLNYAANADGLTDFPALGPITAAASFRPFSIKARIQISATSGLQSYFGISDQLDHEAPPQNLVGIYYSGSGSWQCVVYSGGTLNATTNISAPDTSVHSFWVHASAAGTVTCAVDTTSVTAAGTFPISNPETFGAEIGSTTATPVSMSVYDMRGQVTGLNR